MYTKWKWLQICQNFSEFHLKMSPCWGDTVPYQGVSSCLLQLWVCQEGLRNCEHQISPFSSLQFSNVLSSIISLRFNLSSFFYSTNMLEHLSKYKVFLLAYIWPLGLYSSISVFSFVYAFQKSIQILFQSYFFA